MKTKKERTFQVYQNFVNQIDDLFEYRYRNFEVEELKKIIDNKFANLNRVLTKINNEKT